MYWIEPTSAKDNPKEVRSTYCVYRAHCDGSGEELIAENVSESQFIDETWWQLENDSYKYGVSIASSTNTDIQNQISIGFKDITKQQQFLPPQFTESDLWTF